MTKNPVHAVLAGTLAILMALGAPAGLAAQQSASPSNSAGQKQAPAAAALGTTPLHLSLNDQFMKDRGFFPISISPYLQRRLPEPVLVNSPTVNQMIQNGTLSLSLEDAIRLAVENNLNIDMQRYATWIADTSVLAARGGPNAAGAPLDATATSNLSWSRNNIQVSNPFISGTGVSSISSITDKGAQANFGYQQGFLTGTSFSMAFNNNRTSTTSPASLFNPSIQSSLAFSITQPLLKGFGFLPSEYNIIVAKNNSQIARYNLKNEVITVVYDVENAYWNLAANVEAVKAAQANVQWGEKNLQSAKAQLTIGTLAQLDVVTAQSTLANYQRALIQSQAAEQTAEVTLLNLITKNQMAASLQNIRVVPTDSINTPPKIEIIPYTDAVAQAWRERPDLLAQEMTLRNNNLGVKYTHNELLPSLNLTGNYSSAGLAGNSKAVISTPSGIAANTSAPVVDANGNPVLINGQPVYSSEQTFNSQLERFNAGLLDSWNTLWNDNYPSYSFSLSLTLPLHNRAAQAANAQALLAQRAQEENVQVYKNTIAAQVRNAQINVTQGEAAVQAAVLATKLAAETLADEQKKFQLGVSTEFIVTQDASNLAAAQSQEILAKAQLLEAVVALNQALGRTLQVHNISIVDAATGHVSRVPQIPGTPIKLPSAFPTGAQ